jgi:hypothetical protein
MAKGYNEDDYEDYGGRDAYLEGLAEEFCIDPIIVWELADGLGPNEDFDGLVTSLEDIYYSGYGLD